jgi:hypothetical protein
VIDDQPLRNVAEGLLTGAGYAVLLADTGAVRVAAAPREPPALVLLDTLAQQRCAGSLEPCLTADQQIPRLILRDGLLQRELRAPEPAAGPAAAPVNPRTFLTALRDALVSPDRYAPAG